MELVRKTDYALRMLLDLAHADGRFISVRKLADSCDVPYSFARGIQYDLLKAGLVKSERGAHGGMTLATDPAKTTLRQVIEAMQGSIKIQLCDDIGPDGSVCPRLDSCPYNPVLCAASAVLVSFLESVTLAEIADGTAKPHIPPQFAGEDAFAFMAHIPELEGA